jgi:hypothetical protein
MKFPQENHANDLNEELNQAFARGRAEATVSIAGAGVHWRCKVARAGRLCTIHCFDVRGPEYLISFEEDGVDRAMGRTSSKADTISAVKNWIQGCDVPQLHQRFVFVDQQKRSLESIAAKAIAVCPELGKITRELQHNTCDLYDLWFRANDRSCRIYFYGNNAHPDAIFHWDGCRMFSIRTGDFAQVALLLKRWIHDYVLPSVLKTEFPWIELDKVARYYELGRKIEGEFIQSWDEIEKFYERMSLPQAAAIRALIATMRDKGYDQVLRAGQSLYTLILSRSRRHGLRATQPHVAFHFREGGMDVCSANLSENIITVPEVAVTAEVEAVLKRLEAATVD